MASKEVAVRQTSELEPAKSIRDRLLQSYENLSPEELERIEKEMGEVALNESGELAGYGSGAIFPMAEVDHDGQRALSPGKSDQYVLPASQAEPQSALLPGHSAAEQQALPPGKSQEVQPFTVGHIDLSHNAERKAYDLAGRQIEEMKKENEKRFILDPRRIVRNIWGYNFAHRKALTKARSDIQKAQDINAHDDEFTEDMRKHYGEAIFDQFFNGPDEAIDDAAGENREFFADDHEATVAARDLYAKFAQAGTAEQPAMSDDEFNEAIKKVRELMGEHDSVTATGVVEQNNYLEAAKAMRGRIEEGEAVEDILEGFELVRGESRADARTEAHKTKTDRLLDRYEKSRIGSLVPSTVLAAGISAGAFATTRLMGAGMQTLAFGGGAAVIGAVAGAREHLDITKQRAQMGREKFHGKDYSEDTTKRYEKLSEFEHERVSVDSLLANLSMHQEKLRSGDISKATVDAAFDELASIQVLKDLSAAKKTDLFDHGISSNPNKHLDDRMALAVSQAELKVFLDELLESGNADTYKAFGLDGALPDGRMPSAVVDDAIESRLQSFKDERLKGINAKDEAFNAYRRRESIKKGAKVAAFSLVAGTVIQEVHATFSGDRTGLAEQAWGGNDSPGAHETWLGSALPDQGGTVEHKDFYHTPQMIADLEASGHEVIENHTTTYTTVTEKITAAEYAQSHPGEMRHFKDVRLFTNNTERIDLNELGGQLGKGPEGTVRVWDTMTKNGSIDGGDSLNMTDRSNNVFTIALKQPDGTHIHKIFEYGQDVGKPWADMMYQKQDGTWGFKGDGYIAWGQSADETLNVAASIKGDGGPNTFDISNSIPEVKYDYEIRTPSMDQPTVMPGAVWAPGGSRLGAATRPAGKPEAVTSQELVPLEPTPVGAESDRLPVPAQQNAEPDVIRESTVEQPFNEIETNQRKVAREAGWPLLELDISPNQNVSIEQWKVAAEFVQRSNELRPNITDSMGQLRAAIELAEQEGLDGETRGLLYGLYQINQADNKESGSPESETSRSEEQSSSSSDSRSGSSTQQQAQPQTAKTSVDDGNSSESIPRQGTETQLPPVNPEVTARMEEVNVLLDEVRNLRDPYNRDEYAMASKAQITPELFEKARGIYMNVVRERGSELSTKLVLRYAAAAVHPDRGGDEDTLELYQAITWINEQLRGK